MSIYKQKVRTSERIIPLQSEKMVEAILGMSFGCIAFLRGLFDDDHFEDEKFIVDKQINQVTENLKGNSFRFKRLVRGKSNEADTLLNWLEQSIAESLHKKYLKCICLSIVLNKDHPEELFESYIFGVDYDSQGNPTLSVDDSSDNSEDLISPMTASRRQLQQLMKRFILITQSLPELPAKRYISMRLMFNECCPSNYQPTFFTDCSTEEPATFNIPIVEGHEEEQELDISDCGKFTTKHHNVITKIISLVPDENQSHNSKAPAGFKKFDPFDMLKTDKEETSNAADISQVTKDLQNLGNITTNDQATQIIHSSLIVKDGTVFQAEASNKRFECYCNASEMLSFTANIQCLKCHKYSHAVCHGYYNSLSTSVENFKCYKCKSVNFETDIEILIMIRRIIKLLQQPLEDYPKSVSGILTKIGYDIHPSRPDMHLVDIAVKSLSVMIHHNFLLIKSRKAYDFSCFNIGYDGILYKNEPLKKGKYYIQLNDEVQNEINEFFDPDMEIKGSHTDFESIENSITDSFLMGDGNLTRVERERCSQEAEESVTIDEEIERHYKNLSDSLFSIDEQEQQPEKKRKISKSFDVLGIY